MLIYYFLKTSWVSRIFCQTKSNFISQSQRQYLIRWAFSYSRTSEASRSLVYLHSISYSPSHHYLIWSIGIFLNYKFYANRSQAQPPLSPACIEILQQLWCRFWILVLFFSFFFWLTPSEPALWLVPHKSSVHVNNY